MDCGVGEVRSRAGAGAPSQADLERLSRRRVFFGHQSVGGNIIEGLRELQAGAGGTAVSIEETSAAEALRRPVLAHARIGENKDPRSKIRHFVEIVEGGVGEDADVAFFKLCYIDLHQGDDAEALFGEYAQAMNRLRRAYPRTTFLHVTVPLRVVQSGPRAWVKKLIGRPLGGYADNVVRHRYNVALRETYAGREPIFDLALLESGRDDGTRCMFISAGRSFEALCDEYTEDGGHLNRPGRRRVAEALVRLLAAAGE